MIEYLKRGIAAGSLAGTFYRLFIWRIMNPLVVYMERLSSYGGNTEEAHILSEPLSVMISTGGGVLWGSLLGTAFGFAYFVLEPTLPGNRVKVYSLAAAGFMAVSGVPWLVLPPSVPGIDHQFGIEIRIIVYGLMMILGALAVVGSVTAYSRAADTAGRAMALGVAVFLFVLLVLLGLIAPSPFGGDLPGELVTAFRWLVMFGQAGLWIVIATAFRGLNDLLESPDHTPV